MNVSSILWVLAGIGAVDVPPTVGELALADPGGPAVVAFNPAGDEFLCLWTRNVSCCRRFIDGTTGALKGDEVAIASFEAGAVDTNQLAVARGQDGTSPRYLLVYPGNPGSGGMHRSLLGRILDADGRSGPEVTIADITPGFQRDFQSRPRVAFTGTGFVVLWAEMRTGTAGTVEMNVMARAIGIGGAPSAAAVKISAAGVLAGEPDLAVLDGSPVAIWKQTPVLPPGSTIPVVYSIQVAQLDGSLGVRRGPFTVSAADGKYYTPRIAANRADRECLAVWNEHVETASGNSFNLVAHRVAGEAAAEVTVVRGSVFPPSSNAPMFPVDVAWSSTTDAYTIAWGSSAGTNPQVRGRELPGGIDGVPSAEFLIAAGNPLYPGAGLCGMASKPDSDLRVLLSSRNSAGGGGTTGVGYSWISATPRPIPDPPSNLRQFKADGTSSIAAGQFSPQASVVFKAALSAPNANHGLILHVQIQEASKAFGAGGDVFPPASASADAGDDARVTAVGLPVQIYKWRAWVSDEVTLLESSKVDYGTFDPDFGINPGPQPDIPLQAAQYHQNGTSLLLPGANTSETSIVFKARMGDPDGTYSRLAVEIQRADLAFVGRASGVSDPVAPGLNATVRIPLPGVAGPWKWQMRAEADDSDSSPWVPFGGEDPDFVIMNDGTVPPAVVGALTDLSTMASLRVIWSPPPAGSGAVEVRIRWRRGETFSAADWDAAIDTEMAASLDEGSRVVAGLEADTAYAFAIRAFSRFQVPGPLDPGGGSIAVGRTQKEPIVEPPHHKKKKGGICAASPSPDAERGSWTFAAGALGLALFLRRS